MLGVCGRRVAGEVSVTPVGPGAKPTRVSPVSIMSRPQVVGPCDSMGRSSLMSFSHSQTTCEALTQISPTSLSCVSIGSAYASGPSGNVTLPVGANLTVARCMCSSTAQSVASAPMTSGMSSVSNSQGRDSVRAPSSTRASLRVDTQLPPANRSRMPKRGR
jgi:hypothetical protein